MSYYKKIILDGERPLSRNVLNRMNRYKKNTEQKRIDWLVLIALREHEAEIVPAPCPVDLVFTVFRNGRLYDTSNFDEKMYEDAVVRSGALVDDSPRYVRRIIKNPMQKSTTPRIEIELIGCD